MSRVFILAFLMLLSKAALAECPPPADYSAETDRLYAALRAAPDAASARPFMDELWQIWTTAPDARAQALLDAGRERFRLGDVGGAIVQYDALIAYCPDYAEGYNQRAFARFVRAEFPAALEDLEKALALSPRHVAAMAGQALTLFQLGRPEAGQAILRRALDLNPWLPERQYLVEPKGDDI